jgi:chloride channel 7
MDWGKLDKLADEIGSFVAVANDRAPARRLDEANGRRQRSHAVLVSEFIQYVKSRASDGFDANCVPFYANGIRVFSESSPDMAKKVAEAFPMPYFAAECDETGLIAKMTLEQLAHIFNLPKESADAAGVNKISTSLNKMFISPGGAITRLHYDSGDAHGWLGQVTGRKLFVFYPPSDASKIYVTEESHADLDPLDPDYEKHPLAKEGLRPYACVLAPGEVVLNPRRWFHYAVSLDASSVTVMRNFYHSGTNAEGLVDIIAKTVKSNRLTMHAAGANRAGM